MSEHDLQWISKYYQGELSAAEQRSFQKRMAEDVEFRREAELHERTIKAVRLHGRDQFKKKLGERPPVNNPRNYKSWAAITGLLLIASVLLFYYFRSTALHKSPEVRPIGLPVKVDSSGQLRNALPGQDILKDPKEVQSAQNQKEFPKALRNKLYAAAFQPHEDARTRDAAKRGPNLNGSGPASMESFLFYYQKKEYRDAIKAFSQLPEDIKNDDNHQFYYANALLASGYIKQAEGIFEGIVRRDNSDFITASAWYAALCALKSDNVSTAKARLDKLNSNKNGIYGTKAEKLLKELKAAVKD